MWVARGPNGVSNPKSKTQNPKLKCFSFVYKELAHSIVRISLLKVPIYVFKVPILVFKVPISVFKVPILVFKVSFFVIRPGHVRNEIGCEIRETALSKIKGPRSKIKTPWLIQLE
jgi:hypothetical protein